MLHPSDPPTSDTVPEAPAHLDPSLRADPTVVAPPPIMEEHDPGSAEPPPPAPEPEPAPEPPTENHLVGAAWTFAVLLVILGALAILAKMPLLE